MKTSSKHNLTLMNLVETRLCVFSFVCCLALFVWFIVLVCLLFAVCILGCLFVVWFLLIADCLLFGSFVVCLLFGFRWCCSFFVYCSGGDVVKTTANIRQTTNNTQQAVALMKNFLATTSRKAPGSRLPSNKREREPKHKHYYKLQGDQAYQSIKIIRNSAAKIKTSEPLRLQPQFQHRGVSLPVAFFFVCFHCRCCCRRHCSSSVSSA